MLCNVNDDKIGRSRGEARQAVTARGLLQGCSCGYCSVRRALRGKIEGVDHLTYTRHARSTSTNRLVMANTTTADNKITQYRTARARSFCGCLSAGKRL